MNVTILLKNSINTLEETAASMLTIAGDSCFLQMLICLYQVLWRHYPRRQ
jgi:hypothetical protein